VQGGQPLGVREHLVELFDEPVGGRPPSDSPRSIEPREATILTPSSRAASTSASISPSSPRGKT
jgi:hypothetical protein